MHQQQPSYKLIAGTSPLVAAAIHDGHTIRPNLHPLLALSPTERLREEDPFTAQWVSVTDTHIIGLNSRFELDLNRPRHKAIYRKPEDAWGLTVWNEDLPEELAQESLALYDKFYADVQQFLTEVQQRHGCFVIYDLHTYNHLRDGETGPPADPDANPEVNIGTGNMNRALWAPVVDTFMQQLHAFNFQGRQLDVRENVKFNGGHFMRWVHDTFPESACVLSIEFKKFFMNEWTGEPDQQQLTAIREALQHTVAPVLEARKKVCHQLRPS